MVGAFRKSGTHRRLSVQYVIAAREDYVTDGVD